MILHFLQVLLSFLFLLFFWVGFKGIFFFTLKHVIKIEKLKNVHLKFFDKEL